MPRGGHREKAGRPSTWKSGCKFSKTKLIRVPTAIAEQVLEIAHKIDSGDSLDSVTKSKSVSIEQIRAAAEVVLSDEQVTRGNKDKYRVNKGLKALMKELFGNSFEIETKSKAKQTHLEI